MEIPTIEKDVVGQEVKDAQLEAVAELEISIKKIIEKIRPRIESGEYGLVIGDDASGRIPALILGNFIKKVSEAKGLSGPNLVFIPGKLEMEKEESRWKKIFGFTGIAKQKQHEELDEYISEQGATKEKRILIITDTLQTGLSLKTLVNLLKRAGYNCDIATIGIEPLMIGRGVQKNLSGTDIFSGEYGQKDRGFHQNTPLIYDQKEFSGVYKKPGDSVSKTRKSLIFERGKKEMQDSVNQAREDAGVVTEHLIKWYESLENEK